MFDRLIAYLDSVKARDPSPRSGKSLLARWFAENARDHAGEAIDDAHRLDETALFHRWNRAQEAGTPLLIVGGEPPWNIVLPDLRSRLGAALQLEIGLPDDAMAADLLHALAEQRGLPLGAEAAAYLVPRAGHRLPFATLPWDRKWFPLQDDEWRDKVGDAEAQIVNEECGQVAEQLGYGRLTDTAPIHPALLRLAGLASNAQLVA